jgi:hypothetical protein
MLVEIAKTTFMAALVAASFAEVADFAYRVLQFALVIASFIFACYQIRKIRLELNEKNRDNSSAQSPRRD